MAERLKLEHHFVELPEDNFGVLVLNDDDRLKLIWLANNLGESKLRRGAADFALKNGYQPYVSTISKRFAKKIPLDVYMVRKVLIYRVYCIVTADHSAIKIGYSGDWIARINNLPAERHKALDLMDLRKSFSVLMPGKSKHAIGLEAKTLKALRAAGHQISPPPGFDHYSGVKNEWFRFEAYEMALECLLLDESRKIRSFLTLKKALKWDLYSVAIDSTLH